MSVPSRAENPWRDDLCGCRVYSVYLGQSAALAAAATERMHKSLDSLGNKKIGARITWDRDTGEATVR